MAKYNDKTGFLVELENAGLRLESNTPIVVQREDGSFYLDCSGMFPRGDRDADVAKLATIQFEGAHSKRHVSKDGKVKLHLNLLGQTVPETELANDIAGSAIYQLVTSEKELDIPRSAEEVVALKKQLLGKDDSVYEKMITDMFPGIIDISSSDTFKDYLSQFTVSINPDNTLKVTSETGDINKFKLLLSSMRTQMRTSAGSYQAKIAQRFNNIEFSVVCRRMNAAINTVVEKFASRTLEAAKTARTTAHDEAERRGAEAHTRNMERNKQSVASVVLSETSRRSEENARFSDNENLNTFVAETNAFFEGELKSYVKKHNQKIADWNFAKEQLEEFLKSPEATPFFTEVSGKTFNGQELAEGLLSFLDSKFDGAESELSGAEFGALFVKCYSLMTKETSPEKLLTHGPIKRNPALKAIVRAAKEAEELEAAGPSV